jgi:hypothetical protein
MSDQRATATSPAIGPAQARALRRSSLDDDDGRGVAPVDATAAGRPDGSGGQDRRAPAPTVAPAPPKVSEPVATAGAPEADEVDDADGATDIDSARDAATAADQAARMSQLEDRVDGLLERLRAGAAADVVAAADDDTSAAPEVETTKATRARWRR